jgi:hypothetical protein
MCCGPTIYQKHHQGGTEDEKWRKILQDAQSMTQYEFMLAYSKDWILRRSEMERVITENQGKRAKTFNEILQDKNIWVWEDAGVGKSKWANSQAPVWKIYKKNVNKWWDGFDMQNQRSVILEDYPCFPPGDVLGQHMKVWSDRYPFMAEVKNSAFMLEPGRVLFIVTSNYSIEECITKAQDRAAVQRRFHEIHLTKHNAVLIGVMKRRLNQLHSNRPGRFSTSHISDM